MNNEAKTAVTTQEEKHAEANLAEELHAAIIGIPMAKARMEAAASAAIQLLSLLGTLYDINVEGIEPVLQPMFRTGMTTAPVNPAS
ncbi:hypothetical protein [Paenibacillus sp. XY044]|uniref:hypothetical protein n=1 Tax=Paenibacillus sp. XY044 TaxID=2026089 RepID=UPI000B97EF96|nr:hypothetical protein [Paenibacillus sp. XY044]OZB94966.1 hypothetical protein CJP46_14750 [Paenibacillus sp. XY044]